MSKLNWLAPLGFLGLLALIILILIYILKPNYQQKFVSSTYIWKLSLKYRKRKFPISRLRNLLIIICQILIIVISAALLAQPFLANTKEAQKSEEIIILDSSVSMLTYSTLKDKDGKTYNETCFERAIDKTKQLGTKAINENRLVTIILAGTTADILTYTKTEDINGETVQTQKSILHCDNISQFNEGLNSLVKRNEINEVVSLACDYTGADIDGAISMAQGFVDGNPNSAVTLYSAKPYECADDSINIVDILKWNAELDEEDNVTQEKEWNVAILSCKSVKDDGYYKFTVEVACYNNDWNPKIYLDIYGLDGADITEAYTDVPPQTAECRENKTVTVTFKTSIRSYKYARVFVNENDSFSLDNAFYHYGTGKEVINVIYVSPLPSDTFEALTKTFTILKDQWDFSVRTTSFEELEETGQNISDGGYDFYIFEGQMPEKMPTDGIVVIFNPYTEPPDTDLAFGETIHRISADDELCKLYPTAESSQLMSFVKPERILVNRYIRVKSEGDFKALMYARDIDTQRDDPVYLVNENKKIAVFTISSYMSDISVNNDFIYIFYNMLKSWLPATVGKYVYDVGEELTYWQTKDILSESNPTITLDDGTILKASNGDSYYISQWINGSFSISQTMISGRKITESYFVKIAAAESDFTTSKTISSLDIEKEELEDNFELFFYLAIALILLVFIERLLHMKNEF